MIFGLSHIQLLGAALIAAFLLAGGMYLKGRSDGREAARTASLQSTIDQLTERSRTDEEISEMDDPAICRALGGRVLADGTCD
ncbi:hypothetical protein [Roseibium sp. RKSG952]|uniref:hypothetical protein n=1 Tax=Roseibium sp. RKSG952 TaxID=2529384 RepID=UPI0012BCD551|nr:hypothetical protein [Roseibium sp. RKSG952]MTH94776.1 hypothetical protein [Roseibium sp. RKSG952]